MEFWFLGIFFFSLRKRSVWFYKLCVKEREVYKMEKVKVLLIDDFWFGFYVSEK